MEHGLLRWDSTFRDLYMDFWSVSCAFRSGCCVGNTEHLEGILNGRCEWEWAIAHTVNSGWLMNVWACVVFFVFFAGCSSPHSLYFSLKQNVHRKTWEGYVISKLLHNIETNQTGCMHVSKQQQVQQIVHTTTTTSNLREVFASVQSRHWMWTVPDYWWIDRTMKPREDAHVVL